MRQFKKLLLIMKLSTFLIIVFSLQLSANVYSQGQTFDLSIKDERVKDVLKSIESQSDYRFFYNDELTDVNRSVSIETRGDNIEEVLNMLFAQTEVTYKVMDNNMIVISPSGLVNQQVKVTGTVTDAETKEPLPGVNILVEGTLTGAITEADGHFTISAPGPESVLVFSFIGYKTQKVTIGKQTIINISLEPELAALDEVVVIGYGVQKKSDLTGSVSQVKSEEMVNRSIVRPEQALQGKTAGVQIIQTSGAPGKSATVRIRGFSSNASSDPLYVVDGLRTDDIGSIDPNNIQTMEILKDAASAAIYGAEAGNGVVLITTKKGKKGEGNITYDFQYSVNSLAYIPKIMNSQQYVNYMTEGNHLTSGQIASYWDGKTDTKWDKVAFENSIMQKHNFGFQGGNDKGSYYLSLSYLDQNGIVKGNADTYNRITAMFNADYNVKKWLKVGSTTIIEKWKMKNVSENSEYGSLLASVLTLDPLTPAYYEANNLPTFMQDYITAGKVLLTDEKGRYYGLSQAFASEQVHPLLMRDITDAYTKGGNMMGTVFGEIKPFEHLTFTSKLGYNANFINGYTHNKPFYANAVLYRNAINLSRTNTSILYYQWENYANYTNTFGKHNLNVMLGTSYSDKENIFVTGSGDAVIKDTPLFWDLNYLSPSAVKGVSGGYTLSRQLSYYGRVNYSYDNTWLLSASLRRDAGDSSILPPGNRWGIFPAFSVGYVISNQSFFPKDTPITFAKLRASWGQNGNTGPLGGWSYRQTVSSSSYYSWDNDIAYQVASAPTTLNNPDLKWETSEQLDFGIDLRAFEGRLSFTADYFHKETKDLLVYIIPAYETGISSTPYNAGNVLNEGLEFELGWQGKAGDFSYGISANLATLHNKVTYLDPSLTRVAGATFHTSTVTYFEKGYPVWYMRGYKMTGIDDATGDPVFKDQLTIDTNLDGVADQADGKITEDDKSYIGSAIPDFTYGITLTAAYKGFDLTLFGTGSEGNDIFFCMTRVDRPTGNKITYFYDDRWTPANPTGKRPKPGANGIDKYWVSNDCVMDGSYFKIKQIQLGYTLPKIVADKISVGNFRVYASMDDWFVFTKYPGMDPEASAGSTSAMGVDKGSYPTSRKFVFGVNLTF